MSDEPGAPADGAATATSGNRRLAVLLAMGTFVLADAAEAMLGG